MHLLCFIDYDNIITYLSVIVNNKIIFYVSIIYYSVSLG
nr:MAG TPA_asm: hypothetical protein [Caudoviricetes sp.]